MDYKSRQAARPTHAQAGDAAASSLSRLICLFRAAFAAWLAFWLAAAFGIPGVARRETQGRKLGVALLVSWSCKGPEDRLDHPPTFPSLQTGKLRLGEARAGILALGS